MSCCMTRSAVIYKSGELEVYANGVLREVKSFRFVFVGGPPQDGLVTAGIRASLIEFRCQSIL
jgi:hypothetical protein